MPNVTGVAVKAWQRLGPRFMPFADIATSDVPFGRLFRLSFFQLTVGMVQTLFFGTLNRVMIVELHVSATLVSVMIAIPLLVAPFRALIGFRSDTYRHVLGWRRVPFIWGGTMLQFSGLSIMPFALIILSGDQSWGPREIALIGSAVAFFLVGAGAHTVQTAGLALATDLVDEDKRPRVVALMYFMMLLGTVLSAVVLGKLLHNFSPLRLIQVIQGAALFSIACNLFALWKQEARQRGITPYKKGERRPMFREAWKVFSEGGRAVRLLTAVGLGFFAFNMQDVLLEPYGGEILRLSVGETTALTGIMAAGALMAFWFSAPLLDQGMDPIRLAALGVLIGIVAFCLVIFSSPLHSTGMFRIGTMMIGMGEGFFGVGTLSAAMALKDTAQHGIALGAWGAVFATCEGFALAVSGVIKDSVAHLIHRGGLTDALRGPAIPYATVYNIEIVVLFATLIALGPLVRATRAGAPHRQQKPFGLADIPA